MYGFVNYHYLQTRDCRFHLTSELYQFFFAMKVRNRCLYFTIFFSCSIIVIVFTPSESNELTPIRLDSPERKFYITQGRSDGKIIAATTHQDSTLENTLRCSNTRLEPRFENYNKFVVLTNYVKASKEFRCHESITASAPGDFRFLDNVEPLLDRWRGPISLALYAPGYDFHSTIRSIAYLRQCKSKLIKEYVTFHLFFEHDHYPNESQPLVTAYKDEFNCSLKPPYETAKYKEMFKAQNDLMYPINLARNIAKMNVQTHFVFPLDIELYPTREFIPKFMKMVVNYPRYFEKGTRNVFVLPIFEVLKKVPESKTELLKMLKDESAILFHKSLCSICHRVPGDKGWEKVKVTNDLNVYTSGKRHEEFSLWEPFFVCTKEEPLWDDRFTWEGQGDKMVQAYHMCMLDYNFLVLDNAFLTHKPGVKETTEKYQDQIERNEDLLDELAEELPKIYGENKECKVRLGKRKNVENNAKGVRFEHAILGFVGVALSLTYY